MTSLNYFLEFGAITLSVLSSVVAVIVTIALINHKDAEYKKRYEDFRSQKSRVEKRLASARQKQS